jgi:hypothetical protein
MSCKANAGQNCNVKIGSKSFEDVAEVKYLEMTPTNYNCVHGEIKRRLILENACYHSVHNILSSCYLFKNIKIRIYKTVIYLLFFLWM